jgi:hypothetical protein
MAANHRGYRPRTKIASTVISAKRPKQPNASDTLVRPRVPEIETRITAAAVPSVAVTMMA